MTQPQSQLAEDEVGQIERLVQRLDAELPELEELDALYEGTQRASYMHPEILKEAGDRIKPLRLGWTQLAVDSIVERLFLQGIKSGNEELDREFARVWRANSMDLGLAQAITDALVMRRSYISVGTNEADRETPLVRPESPLELYVDVDPRTGKARAAVRRVCEFDNMGILQYEHVTLYLPDRTVWSERRESGWQMRDDTVGRDVHNLGELPISSLVNRPRTRMTRKSRGGARQVLGRSELEPFVASLTEAGNKLATDMMVAAEFVAIPLRALFGVGPEDFKDESNNSVSGLRAMMGRLLTIPDEEVKAYEFAAAQLSNFTGALRELSQLVSSVTGLPAHYMGTPSDNPASAEAITGAESRLATHSEQKHPTFNPGIRNTARLIHRFITGEWAPELDTAKSDWRNVRTPTVGAMADAAVKLGPKDRPIVPMKQTREALGFEPEVIEAMEAEDEAEFARAPSTVLAGAMSNPGGAPDDSADDLDL